MELNVARAEGICGGLSHTSKMPCPSYNLPANECQVGSTLVGLEGAVCFGCYALKGRYPIPTVQRALYRRLKSLSNPLWADAIVVLIGEMFEN